MSFYKTGGPADDVLLTDCAQPEAVAYYQHPRDASATVDAFALVERVAQGFEGTPLGDEAARILRVAEGYEESARRVGEALERVREGGAR